MRKLLFLLLVGVFAFAGYCVQSTVAQDTQGTAAAEKPARWHGVIVRFDSDNSAMDVRRGSIEKKVYYDSSTKWTQGKTVIEMSQVKEGADVICLGKYDDKGQLHATRVDLRAK